jgi:hypothetical protein
VISWQSAQSAGNTSTNEFERFSTLVAEVGCMLIMSNSEFRWLASADFRKPSNDTTIATVMGPDHSQRHTRPDADIAEFMVHELL